MRIVEIEVEGLFGTFHHKIPLNLEDRMTIIHGPNGIGKTVLLEMAHALFHHDFKRLFQSPYSELTIRFDNGYRVAILQKAADQLEFSDLKKFLSDRQKSFFEAAHVPTNDLPSRFLKAEFFDRSDPVTVTIPFDAVDDSQDYHRIYDPDGDSVYFDGSNRLQLKQLLRELPDWWSEARESAAIFLIHEQRRVALQKLDYPRLRFQHDPEIAVAPVVGQYAKELAETIQEKLAESGELSQRLDRSFPNRLIQRIGKKTDHQNLEPRLHHLESKRDKLRAVGLIDSQEEVSLLATPPDLGNETRDVLAVYIEDTEQKLGIFDDLADRIELFAEIINERFQYKRLRVVKEKGFFLESENGEELALDILSSGEQHELVLVYQLLFKLKPNSLVLIDEPELSLHVVWQQKFLEDLSKITKIASFDALIATHSPQVIHDRWDLTVELQGPAKTKQGSVA